MSITRSTAPSRRRCGAAALAAFVGLGAVPATAMTEFLGGGFLTPARGCESYGWTGTHQVLARMQPQGHPGNPEDETQIALLLATGTIAFRLNINRGFRHVYQMTQATYVWNGPWSPDAPTMQLTFHPASDFPTRVWWEMPELVMRVENFNEHAGCTMWLYLSMIRN